MLVEIYRAEVLAVAAILPLKPSRVDGLAFKIDLPEQVTAILTLDRTLSRSEESSFVFGAEYSHFGCSLQRQVTVQVVLGTKHLNIGVGGTTELKMKILGERFACAHRLKSTGKFCNTLWPKIYADWTQMISFRGFGLRGTGGRPL
jgi:hypothetical protein